MKNRILIYSYSIQSASAKLLKEALGAQFIKKENSQYTPKSSDLVINWGSGICPSYPPAKRLNYSGPVNTAIDKIYTFTRLTTNEIPTVPWTTDINVAKGWLNSGKKVVVRSTTTGSRGKDIEIYDAKRSVSEAPPAGSWDNPSWVYLDWLLDVLGTSKPQETLYHLPNAPLYTQYIEKDSEFRVHVAGGQAIHTQMKLRKNGIKAQEVWNHGNGYTFTSDLNGRVSSGILESVRAEGIKAINALGLDFGACDIAWANGKPYVLEVNTAPGIEEPTLSKYVQYFKEIHGI